MAAWTVKYPGTLRGYIIFSALANSYNNAILDSLKWKQIVRKETIISRYSAVGYFYTGISHWNTTTPRLAIKKRVGVYVCVCVLVSMWGRSAVCVFDQIWNIQKRCCNLMKVRYPSKREIEVSTFVALDKNSSVNGLKECKLRTHRWR